MEQKMFEEIVDQAFHHLPPLFKKKIENVEIIVEEQPDPGTMKRHSGADTQLLGLYHGIPLTQRGTWYGTSAVLPDRISLYKNNIERICRDEKEIREKIYEVLCHEIGHYFGMNERQIRSAMENW
jgi:predicted Zn-dependent protease with MMP-like domain